MDDLKTQVFRKIGYKLSKDHGCGDPTCDIRVWRLGNSGEFLKDELPPIDSQWEVCAKYLVPFMRDRGWGLHISIDAEGENYFNWGRNDLAPFAVGADIVDYYIAKAACKAFMEMEL